MIIKQDLRFPKSSWKSIARCLSRLNLSGVKGTRWPFGCHVHGYALIQLGSVGLHPAPDTAGVHLNPAFHHQLADVFVGKRYLRYQRTHLPDTDVL